MGNRTIAYGRYHITMARFYSSKAINDGVIHEEC